MNDLIKVLEAGLYILGAGVLIGFASYMASYGWHRAKARFPHTIINTGTTNLVIKSKGEVADEQSR